MAGTSRCRFYGSVFLIISIPLFSFIGEATQSVGLPRSQSKPATQCYLIKGAIGDTTQDTLRRVWLACLAFGVSENLSMLFMPSELNFSFHQYVNQFKRVSYVLFVRMLLLTVFLRNKVFHTIIYLKSSYFLYSYKTNISITIWMPSNLGIVICIDSVM